MLAKIRDFLSIRKTFIPRKPSSKYDFYPDSLTIEWSPLLLHSESIIRNPSSSFVIDNPSLHPTLHIQPCRFRYPGEPYRYFFPERTGNSGIIDHCHRPHFASRYGLFAPQAVGAAAGSADIVDAHRYRCGISEPEGFFYGTAGWDGSEIVRYRIHPNDPRSMG